MKSKKDLIIDLLKIHLEGLTVMEISKLLKISRNTVAVYLEGLRAEKKIWIRNVGMAKLNYWGKMK